MNVASGADPAPPKVSLVWYFAKYDLSRTAIMVLLLSLGGVLEGFGFSAVIPLLDQMVSPDAVRNDGVSKAIAVLLGWFGLAPSVKVLLASLVIAFTLKAGVLILAVVQVGFLTARVAMELQLRLIRAVVQAEWQHVLKYPSGYITNALSTEASRSAGTYLEFGNLVADALQVLVYLGVSMLISWKISTIALLVGIGLMALLKNYVTINRRAGATQTALLRSLAARLADALPSLKPLKVMAREHYLVPHFEGDARGIFEASKKLIVATEFLRKGREPLIVGAMAVSLWFLVERTTLESTSIVVLALLFYRTVITFGNVQLRWASIRVGESAFDSLWEHITSAEAASEVWVKQGGLPPSEGAAEVVIENLTFGYDDHEVLSSTNALLQAGRMVALTGPSGSGKTTLTDLITGLLRPSGGRIMVNGIDLADMDMVRWRRRIGYVPQESMLFSDTVRNNVTLGDPEITEDQTLDALRSAGALEFVTRLKGGLDHRIGEGGQTLSGGQKQRLAIARALATQPSLLVLDEPTTALDMPTEAEVCATVAGLKGRLTILAISHQPAIQRIADELWELDRGALKVLPVRHDAEVRAGVGRTAGS